jgi:O-methyltransferase / aklanonic acid methyltransferase
VAGSATKTTVADAFDRASGDYERIGPEFFARFGRRLVELAALRPGMRVLDVGCGTGAALVPAAEKVGPDGHVLGIDLAPRMVRLAAEEVRRRGWTHVAVRVGDAEQPAAGDSGWDAVVAAQVLFFLPDPATALAEYHRILRPGGILAISTFGPDDERWEPLYRALFADVPDDLGRLLTPSGESFSSDARISALLAAAGFGPVRHVTETYDIVFAGPDEWLAWSRSHGALAYWDAIPADRLGFARTAAGAVLERLRDAEGRLHVRTPVRYTVAARGSVVTPAAGSGEDTA